MTIHVGCGLMDQERHIPTGVMANPTTVYEMRIAHTCFLLMENGMMLLVPGPSITFVAPMVGDRTIMCIIYFEDILVHAVHDSRKRAI